MVHPINALTRIACAALFLTGSIASAGVCQTCDTVCHGTEPSYDCCAAAHHDACTGTTDCSAACRCMLAARDGVPSSPVPQRVPLDGPGTDGIPADWLPLQLVADQAAALLAVGLAESRAPDLPVRVLYGVWRN